MLESTLEGANNLQFDSAFEGGNLDAVYYHQQEYRLLIRVDSNTVGHCNYFNFTVRALKTGKYIFRILNINKRKSLYGRGMRPFIRIKRQGIWSSWNQGGTDILWEDSPLCE